MSKNGTFSPLASHYCQTQLKVVKFTYGWVQFASKHMKIWLYMISTLTLAIISITYKKRSTPPALT